ncbi:MAG: 50S ribosomal protein L11 methyltransferase [Clostridia bacterium]|nr:50S ribosomal protein L11 methyltransferase [Clostridia bacterium]
MNWTEITVKVPVEYSETAAAVANMTVPYGIYIEDYSDLEQGAEEIAHINLIDEELVAKDRDNALIHIYISECDNAAEAFSYLKERLDALNIPYTADSLGVDDKDWNENWKKYFKAFEVGERLAVCPSWENYENRDNRTVLQIDPGAAFGTGTHATTSLCLGVLEDIVKEGDTVLDIGTGSGILAIASVLLGAGSAIGVDIDAQSVKTAKENSEINKVDSKTEFVVGDLADKISGKYNIVCANIVADVIIRLFSNVADYMAEGAKLIISGIIDIRADEVEAAAGENGFKIEKMLDGDNWRAYILTK